MGNPLPGIAVGTPYHRRGPLWKTCGIKDGGLPTQTALHTGVDFPAVDGTTVLAARGGVTQHVDFGPAFGTRQLVVLCDDGTEDFYAHMRMRVSDNKQVAAGQKIGEVGNSSSANIGFHLHFERHTSQPQNWSCGIVTNPGPSLRDGPAGMPHTLRVLLSELMFGEKDSSSVRRLQRALNRHRNHGDPRLEITGDYTDETDLAVRTCQQRHHFGNDPVRKSNVGPMQAAHLFGVTKLIVNDL